MREDIVSWLKGTRDGQDLYDEWFNIGFDADQIEAIADDFGCTPSEFRAALKTVYRAEMNS